MFVEQIVTPIKEKEKIKRYKFRNEKGNMNIDMKAIQRKPSKRILSVIQWQ